MLGLLGPILNLGLSWRLISRQVRHKALRWRDRDESVVGLVPRHLTSYGAWLHHKVADVTLWPQETVLTHSVLTPSQLINGFLITRLHRSSHFCFSIELSGLKHLRGSCRLGSELTHSHLSLISSRSCLDGSSTHPDLFVSCSRSRLHLLLLLWSKSE